MAKLARLPSHQLYRRRDAHQLFTSRELSSPAEYVIAIPLDQIERALAGDRSRRHRHARAVAGEPADSANTLLVQLPRASDLKLHQLDEIPVDDRRRQIRLADF